MSVGVGEKKYVHTEQKKKNISDNFNLVKFTRSIFFISLLDFKHL